MEKYCESNELTLNTEKTKCMIFNKSGHLLRTPFYYKNEKLENVNKFKYLGFLLTPSGEIKSGLLDLRDRALNERPDNGSGYGEISQGARRHGGITPQNIPTSDGLCFATASAWGHH